MTDAKTISDIVIADYSKKAQQRFDEYETSDNKWLEDFIEYLALPPAKLLDIGAGSGRDAAWYASQGYEVTAVEPAEDLRRLAREKHAAFTINWVDDRLPKLESLYDQFETFAHVHMNAVVFHLPPIETLTIVKTVHDLLQPKGTFFVSLRNGPKDPDRPMFDVDKTHLLEMTDGLFELIYVVDGTDSRSRPDISWDRILFRKI